MPRPAKAQRINHFENVGLEGEVYSKTKLHVASDLFQFEKKLPYVTALIKTETKTIFGLVDEHNVEIGDWVVSRAGLIGVNDRGLRIYGSVWEKKHYFEEPLMKPPTTKREAPKYNFVGIEGYGVYVPRHRLDLSQLGKVWGKDAAGFKSFPGSFDDQASYACNATLSAMRHAGVDKQQVRFIEVGSESKVYAVKPTASIIAGMLRTSNCFAADNEFACKAGLQSFVNAHNFVMAHGGFGIAVGADSAQGEPNDVLEMTAGDGAAAFVLGAESPIALVEGMTSYTTDTADFWRNEGDRFPQHAGRFSGEPAYYKHVLASAKHLFNKLKLEAQDFDFVVFHQPNAKFPRIAATILGFNKEQFEPGIVFDWIGNTYSANCMLGLAKVLDIAGPYQRILVVSYGSGAGSDAMSLVTTPEIEKKRGRRARSVKSWIGQTDIGNLIVEGYGRYLRNKGLI
ncbi:MAG: hydroxymethylglutaryl-CoA synthase [Candidatus Aenigmarchaeota archaeon]|nr:hydroxymethylglutaryl-CoA synthase [Candidatus Aenigmarchaeota archaeon]